MDRPVFRQHPKAGPEAFKTYQISAPISSHYRDATCREVECEGWAHGFRSALDVSTELGRRQAGYIEKTAGRRYTKTQTGTIVTYDFPAGQACFRTPHKVPLEREPLFLVRGGDYRGNPRGNPTVSRRADEWVDDFATHQQGIADAIERG
jgi:hypothetical protein